MVQERTLDGSQLSLAIVVARFNDHITSRLLSGAEAAAKRHNVAHTDTFAVPGSFELPVVARRLALTGRYDAVVCLGAVVRHETDHYLHVATQAATGIQRVAVDTGVPCLFGVLTCDTDEQALARASEGEGRNAGREAVEAAIETALVLRSIGNGETP
jgi:6,7-dimethyl-8-ribityllumazine synthase